jgi:hypothetical protein
MILPTVLSLDCMKTLLAVAFWLAGVQCNASSGLYLRLTLLMLSPGRVEDWRPCSIGSAYPLLPVSVGSASLSEP